MKAQGPCVLLQAECWMLRCGGSPQAAHTLQAADTWLVLPPWHALPGWLHVLSTFHLASVQLGSRFFSVFAWLLVTGDR